MSGSAEALLSELERPPLERDAPRPFARADRPESPGPVKLNYTHEDCIDAILANPAITQNELALRYGYTAGWISLIINSDAFQAALAKRRDEVISPELRATVEERLRTLIVESSKVLHRNLLTPTCPPNLALGALQIATKAMGYGAREQTVNINTSFVVALPPASKDSKEWVEGRVIDAEPSGRRLPRVDLADPASPIAVGDSRSVNAGGENAV
jgi:hypothetical protein